MSGWLALAFVVTNDKWPVKNLYKPAACLRIAVVGDQVHFSVRSELPELNAN